MLEGPTTVSSARRHVDLEASRHGLSVRLLPRANLIYGVPAGWGVEIRDSRRLRVDPDALDAAAAERLLRRAVVERESRDGELAAPVAADLVPILASVVEVLVHGGDVLASELCLELPARAVTAASPALVRTLEDVDALGAHLAVRLPSCAATSVPALAGLPVSVIVLDPGLHPEAVPTVVALADALELRVVAVGVDDGLALERARAGGCHIAQGRACGPARALT